MKITRIVPKDTTLLVETNKDSKMFRWYELRPEPRGELQLAGLRKWVTDDGLTFSDPEDALTYFQRREAQQPRAIQPGTYSLPVNEVVQQSDRVIVRLKSGDEIIINYAK